MLITGKAGTGKSTLLRYFLEHTKKSVVALAPTGLAAVSIGGQTIHKFFHLSPGFQQGSSIKFRGNTKIFKMLDAIVIDEVSMVRADVFDAMDSLMRKYGKSRHLPFGGVQLLCFGDLFQLPPVVTDDERSLFQRHYDAPYFFSANSFNSCSFQTIELTHVFRQKEKDFINLLDKIRHGMALHEDLSLINARVDHSFVPGRTNDHIVLTSTNKSAEILNQKKLSDLPGMPYYFDALIEGHFKKEHFPVEEQLVLKEKARVIFVKNDPGGMFVNGSLGIVEELSSSHILVKLDDGYVVNLDRLSWDNIRFEYDEETKEIEATTIGRLRQFPIKLAWALTIHKSQGQTFEKVYLDFTSGIWDHGQAYVALSRCTTLNGMVLRSDVQPSHLIVDPRISEFLSQRQTSLQQFTS